MQRVCSEGFSTKYGARPLRRAVQRYVEDVLAECMLDEFAPAGSSIRLDLVSPQVVNVQRNDGQSRQVEVDISQSGMEDSSYDEGNSTDNSLEGLVDMMSDAGLMPQQQPST